MPVVWCTHCWSSDRFQHVHGKVHGVPFASKHCKDNQLPLARGGGWTLNSAWIRPVALCSRIVARVTISAAQGHQPRASRGPRVREAVNRRRLIRDRGRGHRRNDQNIITAFASSSNFQLVKSHEPKWQRWQATRPKHARPNVHPFWPHDLAD